MPCAWLLAAVDMLVSVSGEQMDYRIKLQSLRQNLEMKSSVKLSNMEHGYLLSRARVRHPLSMIVLPVSLVPQKNGGSGSGSSAELRTCRDQHTPKSIVS